MKRRRLNVQLSEEQQLILALLLVILVAVSMLYCLGFASLALRQNWPNTPIPSSELIPSEGDSNVAPTFPLEPTLPATSVP